jgi:hypothetical protein
VIWHKTSTPGDDQSIQLKRSNNELSANLGDDAMVTRQVLNPTQRQFGRGHGKM